MNCKNCGNPIGEGAKFCTACGAPAPEEVKPEVVRTQKNNNGVFAAFLIVVSVFCIILGAVCIVEAVKIRELNDIAGELMAEVVDREAEIENLEAEADLQDIRIKEQNALLSKQDSLLQEQDAQIELLQGENEYYYNEWWELQNEVYFYEEYAGIVDDNGSKRYHTYTCPDLIGEEFFIYNTNEAERLGYYACPKCH